MTLANFRLGLCIILTISLSSLLGALEKPVSVNTQFEDLGERRFRLNVVAIEGDNEGAEQAWRENAQRLCRNPDWLGEPSKPVSYLSASNEVERVLTGTVFCLNGFKDSRSSGSDEQYLQLLEMPLSDFNLPLKTPLYDQLKSGDIDTFLQNMSSIVNEFKNGVLNEYQVASLYQQSLLNDPDQIAHLDRLVELHPESAVGHLLLAMASRDLAWDYRGNSFIMNVTQDNYEKFKEQLYKAQIQADAARKLDPKLPLVWARSIDIYKGLGSTESSLGPALFRESLVHQPESLATHTSFFHYTLPKWHGSRKLLDWLVEDTKTRYHLNPDLVAMEALFVDFEGWLLDQRGLNEDARKKYLEAMNVFPHPTILNSLTNSAFRFGEYDLARQYLDQSLQFNPVSSNLYDSLRAVAVEQRNYLEASRLAYAVSVFDKQATEPLYLRVKIFMAYRRYNDALVELQALLERDKDNSLAIQQLIAQVHYQLSVRDDSL